MSFLVWIVLGLLAGFIGSNAIRRNVSDPHRLNRLKTALVDWT